MADEEKKETTHAEVLAGAIGQMMVHTQGYLTIDPQWIAEAGVTFEEFTKELEKMGRRKNLTITVTKESLSYLIEWTNPNKH